MQRENQQRVFRVFDNALFQSVELIGQKRGRVEVGQAVLAAAQIGDVGRIGDVHVFGRETEFFHQPGNQYMA